MASNTALTSSIRSSRVGIATRSERPVPRLSNRINREKDASRRKNLAGRGCSQSYSTFDTNPGTHTTSIGPSPRTWYAICTSPHLAYLVLGGSLIPALLLRRLIDRRWSGFERILYTCSSQSGWLSPRYDTGPTVFSDLVGQELLLNRKSTRLNSSHSSISYAVFCLKKK